MPDLYEVLGVPKGADKPTIRKAYRKKAKSAHPDAGGSPEKFGALKAAHDILTDDEKRARYDESGQTEFTSDSAESASAMQMVAMAFDEALGKIESAGRKVVQFDMVKEITRVLESKLNAPVNHRKNVEKAIRSNEAMLGRFSAKSGGNILDGMVHQRIAALRQADAAAAQEEARIRRAIDIVKQHAFRADPAEPAAYTSGYAHDIMRQLFQADG